MKVYNLRLFLNIFYHTFIVILPKNVFLKISLWEYNLYRKWREAISLFIVSMIFKAFEDHGFYCFVIENCSKIFYVQYLLEQSIEQYLI